MLIINLPDESYTSENHQHHTLWIIHRCKLPSPYPMNYTQVKIASTIPGFDFHRSDGSERSLILRIAPMSQDLERLFATTLKSYIPCHFTELLSFQRCVYIKLTHQFCIWDFLWDRSAFSHLFWFTCRLHWVNLLIENVNSIDFYQDIYTPLTGQDTF